MTLSAPEAADLRQTLIDILSRELRVPAATIDCEKPFTAYGVDSITALMISGELEDNLGIELPPTLLWDCPNINALSGLLVEQLSATTPSSAEEALS